MPFYLRDIANAIVDVTALAFSVAVRRPPAMVVHSVTVGTAAVQVSASALPVSTHPIAKADPANLGTIYIGISNSVTAANGIPLVGGDPLPFPVDDLSKLWAIASVASQRIVFYAGNG